MFSPSIGPSKGVLRPLSSRVETRAWHRSGIPPGTVMGLAFCGAESKQAWEKNPVERWFAELTTKWMKRGMHRSVKELVASIRTWIANWKQRPKALRMAQDRRRDRPKPRPYCHRINDSAHQSSPCDGAF